MKKRFLSFTAFIALLISLTSCAAKTAEYTVYELKNSFDQSTYLNYENNFYPFPETDTRTDSASVKNKEISFWGKSYSLIYDTTMRQEMALYEIDIYPLKDNDNVYFAISKENGNIIYASAETDSDFSFHNIDGDITEKVCKDTAKTLLKDFIDTSKYECSLSTHIVVSGENDSGIPFTSNKNYDYFYTGPSDISTYYIRFTRMIDGYATSDIAEIGIANDGRVVSFTATMTGEFENFKKIKIDRDKIESVLNTKMNSVCNTETTTLADYTVEENFLIKGNNDDLLMLVVCTPNFKTEPIYKTSCTFLIKVN